MRVEDSALDLSAEEGARLVALGLLAEARTAADRLAEGIGEEPLHDFRVALRRVRSALRTYRPWLVGSLEPRHEKRLRKIARSTNEARDAEVQLAWLGTRRDALAAARHRAGYEFLVARYEARKHGGPEAARVVERFCRAADKLAPRLETYERKVRRPGGTDTSFGALLASLVAEQAGVLIEKMNAIGGPSDQAGVHRARIEGKRLRYLLEPLKGSGPAGVSAAIRRLKRLQDALGELHDAHVLGGELREALMDAASAAELHPTVYVHDPRDARARRRLRGSPRPGLLAVVHLVRERRDALHAHLESEWRAGGMAALAEDLRRIVSALEARAGGELEREKKFLLSTLPPTPDV